MSSLSKALLIFAFLTSAISNALAEPITYFWRTTGDGAFASKPFTNREVTIAVYADTLDVVPQDSGAHVSGPTVVQVDGRGFATFIEPQTTIATANFIGLDAIFGIPTTSYAAYDLRTNSPPFGFFGGSVASSGLPFSTSVGGFSIAHRDAITFEAKLGAWLPPEILINPSSASVMEGDSPVLAVTIAGSMPFAVQWRKNSQLIPGAISNPLTLANVTAADSGDYDVVITNLFGQAISAPASLLVNTSPPVITVNPLSQGVVLGSNILLTANAIGTPPLAWRWFYEGQQIPGATTNTLSLTNLGPLSFGSYWAIASNPLGDATTSAALIDRSLIIPWKVSPGLLPVHSEEVISLTAGDRHFVSLRANGTIETWGENDTGQAPTEPGLNDVVSIAAGSVHTLAVRRDGSVAMWGQFFSYSATSSTLLSAASASNSSISSSEIPKNGLSLRIFISISFLFAPILADGVGQRRSHPPLHFRKFFPRLIHSS